MSVRQDRDRAVAAALAKLRPSPEGAADTAVAVHVALSDPHTQYQKESEKNAASGYAGLDGSTLLATAQHGSGTADGTTFLRGDRTWQVPAGGGEANTYSNAGVGGIGITLTKTGVDLPFKSIGAASAKITIANDAPNSRVNVDLGTVAESDITNLVTDLAAKVPTSRTISTTAPLTGGGDLSANRTLVVSDATTGAVGVVELATDGESAANVAVQGNDSRMSNARTPTAHATSHQSGGSDPIKLDDFAATDDNTDLNASTSAHGLMMKYPGGTTNFLRADGSFAAPSGGPGGGPTFGTATLNFGSRPTDTAPGKVYAEIDVTGLTGLTTATHMDAFIQGDTTADHGPDEHIAEDLEVRAKYLSATSLRLYGLIKTGRAWGQFTAHYATAA